jgi:hypothetical protein
MLAANTSNIKTRRDKYNLARFYYRLPEWPCHLYSDQFLDRFIFTNDLYKMSYEEYLNHYSARILLCESPVGYLVMKTEAYLVHNNQKPLGVIRGKWPSLQWIIEIIRVADPQVRHNFFNLQTGYPWVIQTPRTIHP